MTSLRRVSIDELERALFTARVRAQVAQRKWMMCGPDTPMGASALFKLRLALEREITTAKEYSDALQNIWVQEPARLIAAADVGSGGGSVPPGGRGACQTPVRAHPGVTVSMEVARG